MPIGNQLLKSQAQKSFMFFQESKVFFDKVFWKLYKLLYVWINKIKIFIVELLHSLGSYQLFFVWTVI